MERREMGGIKSWALCDKCIAYEAANPRDPFDGKKSKRSKVRIADAVLRDPIEAPPLLGSGCEENSSQFGEPVVFTLERLAIEFRMFPRQLKCFAGEHGVLDATKWTDDWQFSHRTVVQLRKAHCEVARTSEYFYVPQNYSIDPVARDVLQRKGLRMYLLFKRIVEPQNLREQDFLKALRHPSSETSELVLIWSRFVDWCNE
jgi:hypothetical protein